MLTRRKDLKMEPEVQKELLKNMRRLMQEPSAKAFFNEPVDPEALGIPEYPLVIKQPMDLGLIFWKLKDCNYKFVKHFFDDLNLVWDNCQKFNQKGSAVFVASEKLDVFFQKLWTRSKKTLKLMEDDQSLGISSRVATNTNERVEEGIKRKRGIVNETESSRASVSPPPLNRTNPKLKIRLGKSSKKDPEASTGASTSNARCEKVSSLDEKTISNLETCIGILHQLLNSSDAVALIQAPTGGTFMSLSEICASLTTAKDQNWTSSQFSTSKDVLHEAQLFLKNQAVKNEHKRKTLKACNDLLSHLEVKWAEAGLNQDLEGLKNKSVETNQDSASLLPESNLRITKARVEKLKRQQMEKEVKVAQDAIAELENLKKQVEEAKNEVDQFKDKSREQVRDLDAQQKSKLTQLADLSHQKHQVQRRKERALAAIASAQTAINQLREKEEKVKSLRKEESKLLEALGQHHFETEIQPRDAVIVDIRTYSPKKPRPESEPESNINELGSYWFSLNK